MGAGKKRASSLRQYDFDTLDLSDLHLGKNVSQAALLFEFLSHVTCKRLILNGDILDGWKMIAKKHRKFPEMHMRVMDRINALAAGGTEVVYLAGNHDDRLRGHWDMVALEIRDPSPKKRPRNILGKTFTFRNHRVVDGEWVSEDCPVHFADTYTLTDPRGRVKQHFHGDQLDPRILKTKRGQKLSKVGDVLYDASVQLNAKLLRKARDEGTLKSGQFSLSKYLKRLAKDKFGIIDAFETAIAEGTKEGVDIVACGHIHYPELRENYHNSGDWVENASAIACDHEGEWRLINWEEERREFGHKKPPSEEDENPYAAYRNITKRQLRWAQRIWPSTNLEKQKNTLETRRKALDGERARLERAYEELDHDRRELLPY